MARSDDLRGAGASIVGWLIVGILALVFFRVLIGAVGLLLRGALILIVVGGLIWLYFRLKGDGDE